MEDTVLNILAMTYNIAGGRDYNNLPAKFAPDAAAEVIKSADPAFCALNEVDFNLPRSKCCHLAEYIGDKLGYYSYFGRAVTWGTGDYGNALISKYPIYSAETIPVHDPQNKEEKVYYETRCIIKAKVSLPERETTVIVTHFGLALTEQMNSVSALLKVLADTTGPCILLGDFNVTPEHPLLAPLGFLMNSAYDKREDKDVFSFPSRQDISPDYYNHMIDYIYTSRDFEIKRSFVKEASASDHKPFLAELSY